MKTETKLNITVGELADFILRHNDFPGTQPTFNEHFKQRRAVALKQARRMLAADALYATIAILGDWPRRSATVDGELSADPAVGLANVRRFSRAALALADGKGGGDDGNCQA